MRSKINIKKLATILGLVGLLIGICLQVNYYFIYIKSNVGVTKETLIFIPTGSDFPDVVSILTADSIIKNVESFKKVALRKGYVNNVKPGCYGIKPKMGNRNIVGMLLRGIQKPVRVTFNSIRTIEILAQRISQRIEADSASIVNYFLNSDNAKEYGFDENTFISMLIPNTYEFYWNTDAKSFAQRMRQEYDKFWNNERRVKADKLKLTPVQVSILASILDEETNYRLEMPTIAGVYLNRLRKGIPLQADPTIKYAIGDFSIRRVLSKQLKVDSPYNTYKYAGLPPGPIRIPSVIAIDAVLNAENHKYLYFCASVDKPGRHDFSRTLLEHNRKADAYRRSLNRGRIYR